MNAETTKTTAQLLRECAESLASHPHAPQIILQGAAELERLQRILDHRPAINAGLPETYIEWSLGVYTADYAQVVGHDS